MIDNIEQTPLEEWRPIMGYGGIYEGRYEVSNHGRVKSLDSVRVGRVRNIYSKPERILKPLKTRCGYCVVHLVSASGKTKDRLVHRLVAEAFIPNPCNYPQINHKDEDKTNNRSDNLEWCTRSYNINHGTRNKRVAEKLMMSKGIPILQFTKEGEFVKEWKSATEVERTLGYKVCAICNCVKGISKTSYGFIWKRKIF